MSAFEAAAAAEGAPKGVLVVDILSARGLSGMGGFGDTIDAFATVEIDGADEPFGKTETLSDETKPVWNARFVTLVPAEAEISGARIKFNVDEVEDSHLPISLRITAGAFGSTEGSRPITHSKSMTPSE